MEVIIKGHNFNYEITSLCMMFFPFQKTDFVDTSKSSDHIVSKLIKSDDKAISFTQVNLKGSKYTAQKSDFLDCDIKNLVKFTFYKACSKATGIVSPWGVLTGIRPLSVYSKVADKKKLTREYLVSEGKVDILQKIAELQSPYVAGSQRDVSIYISIPFCPGKCSYCSFISVSATRCDTLLERYFDLLLCEIKEKAKLIKTYHLNIKSIYVGGGTPGVLSTQQIHDMFSLMEIEFGYGDDCEICFELGRPDTFLIDKVLVLKMHNVDRICINTQSTNDDILRECNRNHTAKDYFDTINAIADLKFKSVNTDLIAGLPGETTESFKKSLIEVVGTGVDNITVHTLAIKKSSQLKIDGSVYSPVNQIVSDMIDFAYQYLHNNGFEPYYIYRQKNCLGNGENVGFCKHKNVCKYNIFMMEDVHSVIACGAGASSKIVHNGIVNRVINVKYPMEYVNENDKVKNNTSKINDLLKEILPNG